MRVFVDENWCSSGLALSVHNLLSRARIIRIRIRLDLLLFDCSLDWESTGNGRSHSRKEACIIFIQWSIGIIPPAPNGAKISRSFLFGGFVVIADVVLILRMIRLVAPRAQRVGRLRGPHLTRHRSASCFEWRTFVRALTKKLMSLGRRAKRALVTLWWHDIDEVEFSEADWKYVSEMWSKFALKTTLQQSNIHAGKMAAKGNVLVASCWTKLHESCAELNSRTTIHEC